jgi:hypothetical protein
LNDPLTNVLRPDHAALKTSAPESSAHDTGFPRTGFPTIKPFGPRLRLSVDDATGQREGASSVQAASAVVTPNQPVLLGPANGREPRIRRIPLIPPDNRERQPAQDADRDAETLNPLRQSDATSNPLR